LILFNDQFNDSNFYNFFYIAEKHSYTYIIIFLAWGCIDYYKYRGCIDYLSFNISSLVFARQFMKEKILIYKLESIGTGYRVVILTSNPYYIFYLQK